MLRHHCVSTVKHGAICVHARLKKASMPPTKGLWQGLPPRSVSAAVRRQALRRLQSIKFSRIIRKNTTISQGKDASAAAEAMIIIMKHTKALSILALLLLTFTLLTATGISVYADDAVDSTAAETKASEVPADEKTADTDSMKAIAAALAVGVVAAVGAVSMAVSISKSTESMARQPEAAGKINSAMMLGLVFIETAIIYALIVAILIIFVL